MLNLIAGINKYWGRVESVLLVLILFIMVSLGFVQVVLRNFFSIGISWADPFLRHLVLWITFLGASLSTAKHKHINIDAISRFLPPKGKLIARVITDLASFVVVLFLTRASYVFVKDEMDFGSIAFGTVPAWVMELIIPVAFAIIALRFFGNMIVSVIQLWKGDTSQVMAFESNEKIDEGQVNE